MFRLKKIRLLYPAAKPSNNNNSSNKKVITYPKSWTGPWTLDSGLWSFPPKLNRHPENNLYISPHKTSSPQKKIFFPQIKNTTASVF